MSSVTLLTFVAVLQTASAEMPADSTGALAAPDSMVAPEAHTDSTAASIGGLAGELPVGTTPSELVAQRIREALGEPGSAASWQRLADALPGLADAGGAPDPELTRAGLLADSIAREARRASPALSAEKDGTAAAMGARASPLERVAGPAVGPAPEVGWSGRFGGLAASIEAIGTRWAPLRQRLVDGSRAVGRSVPSALAQVDEIPADARLGFGGLALWLAAMGLARTGRRRCRARASAATTADATPSSAYWAVRHLAATGVPLSEIARKTGMAQDAVTFILSPAARIGSAGEPAGQPPSGEGPVPPLLSTHGGGGGQSGIALRDGRVTYGPPGQPASPREEGLI